MEGGLRAAVTRPQRRRAVQISSAQMARSIDDGRGHKLSLLLKNVLSNEALHRQQVWRVQGWRCFSGRFLSGFFASGVC